MKDRVEREMRVEMKKRKQQVEVESSALVFVALSGHAHSEPHVQMEAVAQQHLHVSTETLEHQPPDNASFHCVVHRSTEPRLGPWTHEHNCNGMNSLVISIALTLWQTRRLSAKLARG